jgi:hypothetical protein
MILYCILHISISSYLKMQCFAEFTSINLGIKHVFCQGFSSKIEHQVLTYTGTYTCILSMLFSSITKAASIYPHDQNNQSVTFSRPVRYNHSTNKRLGDTVKVCQLILTAI